MSISEQNTFVCSDGFTTRGGIHFGRCILYYVSFSVYGYRINEQKFCWFRQVQINFFVLEIGSLCVLTTCIGGKRTQFFCVLANGQWCGISKPWFVLLKIMESNENKQFQTVVLKNHGRERLINLPEPGDLAKGNKMNLVNLLFMCAN